MQIREKLASLAIIVTLALLLMQAHIPSSI